MPQNLRSCWKHLCSLSCTCCALVFLIVCVILLYGTMLLLHTGAISSHLSWICKIGTFLWNNMQRCSYCQSSMPTQILWKSYNQGFTGFILTKKQILFLLQVLQFLLRLLGPKNNPSDVHRHGQNNLLSDSTSEEKSHIVFLWFYQKHTPEETNN